VSSSRAVPLRGPSAAVPDEARGTFVAAFRGAVQGADAYRLTRAAVRLEGDLLRIGNRFVSGDRYREIAFVAVGNAAASQAMAVVAALGERVTQGFVAAPVEPPASVPFRSELLRSGPGLTRDDGGASAAALELAGGLGPRDLLLTLLSPGALGALALPPPELGRANWDEFVRSLAETGGATPFETEQIVRILAGGAVGGALGRAAGGADVDAIVLDRGSGGASVGGGPTRPIGKDERRAARDVLARSGLLASLPPRVRARLESAAPEPTSRPTDTLHRPVVVAGPAEALRGASDALIARRWVCRLGALTMPDPPELGAERLIDMVEAQVRDAPSGGSGRTAPRGLAVFAGLELGLVEGIDEGPALQRFLSAARVRIRRRGMTVGAFRTFGGSATGPAAAGGFVGADFSDAGSPARSERSFAMRPGVTDVGCLAIALISLGEPRGRPAPATDEPSRARREESPLASPRVSKPLRDESEADAQDSDEDEP
jgi:hypothetical protein